MHLNSGHEARQYDLNIPNSYEIGEVRSVNGKYVSTVTVISAYYAMQHNADVHYDHVIDNSRRYYIRSYMEPSDKDMEAPGSHKNPNH